MTNGFYWAFLNVFNFFLFLPRFYVFNIKNFMEDVEQIMTNVFFCIQRFQTFFLKKNCTFYVSNF